MKRAYGEGICFTCKHCDGFTTAGWPSDNKTASKCVNRAIMPIWFETCREHIEDGYEGFDLDGFARIPRIEVMTTDEVCPIWKSRFE